MNDRLSRKVKCRQNSNCDIPVNEVIYPSHLNNFSVLKSSASTVMITSILKIKYYTCDVDDDDSIILAYTN